MTDLFAQNEAPRPKRNVGYGNAMFLCDLADGVSDPIMRERFKRGDYPDLHIPSVAGWRRMAGRSTQGA